MPNHREIFWRYFEFDEVANDVKKHEPFPIFAASRAKLESGFQILDHQITALKL